MSLLMRSVVFAATLIAVPAFGAASGTPLTPANVSVLGGETRTFAARFFTGSGAPAAGESVQFVNDACGIFSNGGPVITVQADATGLAEATFTARPQGITCYVAANAGASQVRWNVLTFTLPLVHFQTTLTPPEPRPGEPYVLTVRPMAGAYPLYEADVSARVIGEEASASLAPGGGNSGQMGSVAFQVTPDHRVGDYAIEVAYRGKTQRIAIAAPEAPWQDLWWGGSGENGWGVSIVQHRDMLFSVIYAYDAAGEPAWYVMPGGAWNEARTEFSGAVYAPKGTPFHRYDAAGLEVGAPVGSATLRFTSGNRVLLDYSIAGAAGWKTLERQPFAPVSSPALPTDFGDMWWGGPEQNGWGISVLQRYRTLFAVWFTYDESGAARWFVMPQGFWRDASTYEGRIYRTSGSPWDAAYDAGAFRIREAGTFRFRFGAEGATFDYTLDGRSGTMALWRQPF